MSDLVASGLGIVTGVLLLIAILYVVHRVTRP